MRWRILMTDPAHFEVRYAIYPWMRPTDWAIEHRLAAPARLARSATRARDGRRGDHRDRRRV